MRSLPVHPPLAFSRHLPLPGSLKASRIERFLRQCFAFMSKAATKAWLCSVLACTLKGSSVLACLLSEEPYSAAASAAVGGTRSFPVSPWTCVSFALLPNPSIPLAPPFLPSALLPSSHRHSRPPVTLALMFASPWSPCRALTLAHPNPSNPASLRPTARTSPHHAVSAHHGGVAGMRAALRR